MGVISEIRLRDNYTSAATRVTDSALSMGRSMEKSARKASRLDGALKQALGKPREVEIRTIRDKKVRKDVQRMQSALREATDKDYVVKITTKDSATKRMRSALSQVRSDAKNKLGDVQKEVKRTSKVLTTAMKPGNIKVSTQSLLRARREARKLEKDLRRTTGKRHRVRIVARGHTGPLDAMRNKVKALTNKVHNVVVRVREEGFNGKGGGLGGVLGGGLAGKALKIGGAATAAGAAGAVAGGKALFTQGAELESQKISMTHFLGGDQKAADAYMKKLRREANMTPFSSTEVVSAGTRAIQIAEGDTKQGMQLVRMAEDMAALTPGKTISDAMEALADMQMGEMERMKEFGFKGTKESFDAAGGDITKMKSTTGKTIGELFGGGAEKLSKSGSGKVSTITGNLQSGVQDAGFKIIERLSPVLDKLVPLSERIGKDLPGVIDTIAEKSKDIIPVVAEIGRSALPILKSGLSVIGAIAQNVGAPAVRLLGAVITKVAIPVLRGAGKVISAIANGVVVPVFKGIGSVIQNVVVPAFDRAATFVGGVFTTAVRLAKGAVEGIKSAFNRIKDAASAVSRAFNRVKSAVENAVGALSGIGGKITSAISSIGPFGGGGKKKRKKKAKGHAGGTSYLRSGLTKINEMGEELWQLPNGMKIYPSGKTTKIMQRDFAPYKQDNSKVVYIKPTIHIHGADPKDSKSISYEIEKVLRRLAVTV